MRTHKDGGRNKVQLVLLEIGANIKQKNQTINLFFEHTDKKGKLYLRKNIIFIIYPLPIVALAPLNI